MKRVRKLYTSSSDDRWYLVHDPATSATFVRHEANSASGGAVAHVDLVEFLASGKGPEQQALLRLIGTLAEDHAEA